MAKETMREEERETESARARERESENERERERLCERQCVCARENDRERQ